MSNFWEIALIDFIAKLADFVFEFLSDFILVFAFFKLTGFYELGEVYFELWNQTLLLSSLETEFFEKKNWK